MDNSNDSALSDDWSPGEESKRRPRVPNPITDDDTDTSEGEIVETSSDDEDDNDESDSEISDAETAIINDSFEDELVSNGLQEKNASRKEPSSSATTVETSTRRQLFPRSAETMKSTTGTTRKQASPNNDHVTSTPLVSGLKKPTPLDLTVIPSSVSNFNATMAEEADESWEDWNKKRTATIPSTSSKKTPTMQQADALPHSSKTRKEGGHSSVDDAENLLVAGLNDISLKGTKEFAFRKKAVAAQKTKAAAAGATSLNYFDDDDEEEEEEEEEESLSANFDFDSGNGDSDIQGATHKEKETVTLYDSDDEIGVLTKRVEKLPLGAKTSNKEPAKKSIFLNEPPPIERKTYAYDPSSVRQEEFYGDVQRTVTKMAKTMEEMPMPDDNEELALPKGLVNLFDHQLYGLRWLSWREREFPGGGILADEMGLGKTIMIIALIMKSKADARLMQQENWIDTSDAGDHISCKTTLVVCPVGCLDQWKEEIQNKGKGLQVHIFHGQGRKTKAAVLAQYDVVLTTYHTVLAEIPKDSLQSDLRSPLKRLYWRRIVLDEAHNIRNPKTGCALAICQLMSRNRWAVTGTPVHNRPEDFYSFVKFLKMKPFDDPKVWDFWIGMKTIRKTMDAQHRLHILAKSLVMRRTKAEVQEAGGNVKKIPPKTINIVEVELSEEETRVYDYLMKFCQSMMQKFIEEKEDRTDQLNAAAMTYTAERRRRGRNKQNDDDVPTDVKFSHLFALLTRLRQCAVLPHLITTMLEEEEIDEDVSFDELNDEHIISKINPVFDQMYLSSKLRKILDDVEALKQQAKAENRPMEKVVVISSWTSTLEILREHFRKRRISCVSITGKDTTDDRTASLKKFNNYPEKYHVCLLSLMAGGVGLNLVGGNHVYFMEPHWNPQLELQAQDRVHRFGQTKNVTVNRYISKKTVEARIMEIQDNKKNLADGVLNSAKVKRGGGLALPQLLSLFTSSS